MPIGLRGALLARRDTCDEKDLLACGPILKALTLNGREINVTYDYAAGLKTNDGAPPKAFWISADGKDWKLADARIAAETVILKAPKRMTPKYVRYAYAAMPKVNLVNKADLPAYPFNAEIH